MPRPLTGRSLLGFIGCVLLGGGGCAAPQAPAAGAAAVDAEARESLGRRDEVLARLQARQQQLQSMLRAVEQRLLATTQPLPSTGGSEPPAEPVAAQTATPLPVRAERGPGDLPRGVIELLERRLVITIALGWVEQQLQQRRVELGSGRMDSAPSADAHGLSAADRWMLTLAAGPGLDAGRVDAAVLLQQAELELDAARRRQLVRDRGGPPDLPARDFFNARGSGAGGALDGLFGVGVGTAADRGVTRLAERETPGTARGPVAGAPKADKKKPKRPGAGSRAPVAEPAAHRKRGGRRDDAPAAVVGKGGLLFAAGGEGRDEEEERSEETARRASVVAHGAPPAGVMAAVRRQLSPMLGCIPESLRAQGPIRFRVKARLGGDGQLHQPVVSSGGLLPPTAVGCLTDLLVRVRVPASEDGTSRVIGFPVWLTAPE